VSNILPVRNGLSKSDLICYLPSCLVFTATLCSLSITTHITQCMHNLKGPTQHNFSCNYIYIGHVHLPCTEAVLTDFCYLDFQNQLTNDLQQEPMYSKRSSHRYLTLIYSLSGYKPWCHSGTIAQMWTVTTCRPSAAYVSYTHTHKLRLNFSESRMRVTLIFLISFYKSLTAKLQNTPNAFKVIHKKSEDQLHIHYIYESWYNRGIL
jgi:hypothetical protein